MPPALSAALTKYASKGRDGTFALLLAAGTWLANEVKHNTETIKGQLVSIQTHQQQTDARLARLEQIAFTK
jgi:hypothetical protein